MKIDRDFVVRNEVVNPAAGQKLEAFCVRRPYGTKDEIILVDAEILHKARYDLHPFDDLGLAETVTETDPHGKSANEPGAKLDAQKVRMGLVINGFATALHAVGMVGTYGAKKYTDNGWMSVPKGYARYTDAMYRHLLQEAAGELMDPDTGLYHAAHAAWNALARLELLIHNDKSAGAA